MILQNQLADPGNGGDHRMPNPAADLAWGAEEIGAIVNLNRIQAAHLLRTGVLPGRKVGNRWVASRRQLRALMPGGEAA